MPEKRVLLGYRRKSMVRNQADMVSPERQMRMCEMWVEMHGDDYTIEWYEDVDGHRSGRDEKGRPGWQILLKQLDRMYRNVHQFLNFLNRLEQSNEKLITVKVGSRHDQYVGAGNCDNSDGHLSA